MLPRTSFVFSGMQGSDLAPNPRTQSLHRRADLYTSPNTAEAVRTDRADHIGVPIRDGEPHRAHSAKSLPAALHPYPGAQFVPIAISNQSSLENCRKI